SGQPENSITVYHAMTRSPSNRANKVKGIATSSDASALKASMPLMEQGGSTLNLSVLKRFRTLDDPPLTIEEAARIMQ
ncbi:hypothetical protein Tco_1276875, partial [Tanacetum coccineum]